MQDPPVLIPNTEVKLHRADGTVRDTVWESRTLPHFIKDIAGLKVMQCPLTYVSGAACVFYMHAAPVGGTADSGISERLRSLGFAVPTREGDGV